MCTLYLNIMRKETVIMNEEIVIQEVPVDGSPVEPLAIVGTVCGGICLGLGCADGGGPAPTGLGCGGGCDGAGCGAAGVGVGCGGACAGGACGGLC